jgi:hypothetical protein
LNKYGKDLFYYSWHRQLPLRFKYKRISRNNKNRSSRVGRMENWNRI